MLGTGAVVNPYGGPSAYGLGVEAAGTTGGTGGPGGGRVLVTAPASGSAAVPPSASALRPASGPDSAHVHGSAEPSRAGSRAGEGRERPGRSAQPTTDENESGGDGEDTAGLEADEGDDGGRSAGPTPADSASPQEAGQEAGHEPGVVSSPPALQPVHQSVTHAEDPTEPVLRILPLGSGLILIGLGLGLAFIGLRVRRG